jgi:hypothetical protein
MEDDAGKKPSPRKSKKKVDASGITSDQLQQLLREALSESVDAHNRKTASNINAINGTLEEFLQTYLVLGYDLDGRLITLINTKTPQEADALSTAITRFFMQHNHD